LSKSTSIIYLVLFLVAFAAKFGYLHERSAWPDFSHPTLDSKYHDEWGLAIATDDWAGRTDALRDGPYFRAPLYAYFVAAVYRAGGHDYYSIRLIQILIGALSAILVFRLASLLFNHRVGWLAFFLYLGYWPVTYFENELLIPVLVVFLDLLALVLLVDAGRTEGRVKRPLVWIAAGVALGLSAVARPNVLLVVPFLLIWVWKQSSVNNRRTIRPLLLVLGAIVVVILPVTIRNAVVGNDFVPIASQGGVNFFIGNNPDSDGVRAVVPGTRADWWGGFDDTRDIAERERGRSLKPSEVSNYWYGEGFGYLAREPANAFRLYSRKLLLFFGNGEVSNNRQLYFVKRRSLVLGLMAINFAFVLGFGIIGIVLRNRGDGSSNLRKGLRLDRMLPLFFMIPYAVSVIIFFVTSRYRLPVSVLLVPYAAFALLWLYERFRRGDIRSAVVYSLIAVIVFAGSLANPLGVGGAAEARGFYTLGVDYSHSDYEKALEAFDESIAQDPSFAPAWKMRGWANYKMGRHVAATEDLLQAVRLDSSFVDALYTLGVVFQVRDQHDRAGPAYQRVIELDPEHKEALTNLADVHMRRGEYDLALPLIERSLEVDRTFPNAIFGLGSYYEHIGRFDDAKNQYSTIVHLPAGRLGLIRLLVKDGKLDEAKASLHQWASAYPQAPDIATLRRLVQEYGNRNAP